MPVSRFLKIVQETGQTSNAVSTCQFLLPGTTLQWRTAADFVLFVTDII